MSNETTKDMAVLAVRYCMSKDCNKVRIWEYADGSIDKSNNIDGWPLCKDCMKEHCCSTNCLQCEYGKYPDCRFLEMKKILMGKKKTGELETIEESKEKPTEESKEEFKEDFEEEYQFMKNNKGIKVEAKSFNYQNFGGYTYQNF